MTFQNGSKRTKSYCDISIPMFCEHYQPLLVEEIGLEYHPYLLHHGKCVLIGYLKQRSNYLESLMIPSLPIEMQLPDATCSIRLNFNNFRGLVPRNCTVRVYGTILLYGPHNSPHMNSRDLASYLSDLIKNMETSNFNNVDLIRILCETRRSMKLNYIPYLDVHDCERVIEARELIGCNLRLKCINKKLQNEYFM
ncbi:uncharacterized protein LOC134228084 [Armigeres subalbatus]|uniref:uncharacterized protein LOC134228084 n=1 Tax=Armigeres subalbatus TaxID=124917 RepID=UPI002ED2194D